MNQSTTPLPGRAARRTSAEPLGVSILGVGHRTPDTVLTNDNLSTFMDTSDEWIAQRTGIRQRHICDPNRGESTTWLCTEALNRAIADAGIEASEIDQVILATVTGEMTCPATACRVAAEVGAIGAGAFDLAAACSGFVYGMNLAHDQIRVGSARTIAVVGCDVMSSVLDYDDRASSILFGDAAGAAILRADEDRSKGILASAMHANGQQWADLYIPTRHPHLPPGLDSCETRTGVLHMNGREVYKFAVGTFARLIGDTLETAGVSADDVDMFVCHQSNARMLESARERFGIPQDKLFINIDRFGNCSAGSVPTVLSELRSQGRCMPGDLVMMVAFGGGLTWASSLWQF